MLFKELIPKANIVSPGRGKLAISLGPLLLATLIVAFFLPAYGAVSERQVLLEVDCAQSRGQLSPYLFGATSGFINDAKGLALCKQAGFQLMEVLRDMGADPFGPGPLRPPPGFLPPPHPPMLNQRSGPGSFPRGSSFDGEKRRLMASRPRLNTFDEVKQLVGECLSRKMMVMVAFTILGPPRDGAAFQKQVAIEVKELQRIVARLGTRIRLFRFGCEPDLPDFWRGTPQQFYKLIIAFALKKML